jgi:hypothetical protein
LGRPGFWKKVAGFFKKGASPLRKTLRPIFERSEKDSLPRLSSGAL